MMGRLTLAGLWVDPNLRFEPADAGQALHAGLPEQGGDVDGLPLADADESALRGHLRFRDLEHLTGEPAKLTVEVFGRDVGGQDVEEAGSARAGPLVRRGGAGVHERHVDAVLRDPEGAGDFAGEHRARALADVDGAAERADGAVGPETDHQRRGRRIAAHVLDNGREAAPDELVGPRWLGKRAVVVDGPGRVLQQLDEVDVFQHLARGETVAGPEKILPPKLERVHSQRVGQLVGVALVRPRDLRDG